MTNKVTQYCLHCTLRDAINGAMELWAEEWWPGGPPCSRETFNAEVGKLMRGFAEGIEQGKHQDPWQAATKH